MTSPGLPAFGTQNPPHDAHALAARILAGSGFHVRAMRPPSRTWWDVPWQWLLDRLNDLGTALGKNVHLSKGASIAIGDVLIAVVALGLVAVIVILLRNAMRAQEAAGDAPASPRAAAEEFLTRSLHAANSGDFSSAVVLLFLASLRLLDVRGVVADDPSFTVNECRREVRRRASAASAPFDVLARAFTAALYAGLPADAESWLAARAAYDAIARGFGDAI